MEATLTDYATWVSCGESSEQMKWCGYHKVFEPKSGFGKHTNAKDGLRYCCQVARRAIANASALRLFGSHGGAIRDRKNVAKRGLLAVIRTLVAAKLSEAASLAGYNGKGAKTRFLADNPESDFIDGEYMLQKWLEQKGKCKSCKCELLTGLEKKDERYYQTASIDQIRAGGGYVKGNCEWLCQHCNVGKNEGRPCPAVHVLKQHVGLENITVPVFVTSALDWLDKRFQHSADPRMV